MRTITPALDWRPAGEYTDVRYETAEGIAKITIDRPEVRNAFRPLTVRELSLAFEAAREDPKIGVVILTGEARSRSARAGISGSAARMGTSRRGAASRG